MKPSLEEMTKSELLQIISGQKVALDNNSSKIEFLTKDRNNIRQQLETTTGENTRLRSELAAQKDQVHHLKQVIHTLGEGINRIGLALSHY